MVKLQNFDVEKWKQNLATESAFDFVSNKLRNKKDLITDDIHITMCALGRKPLLLAWGLL